MRFSRRELLATGAGAAASLMTLNLPAAEEVSPIQFVIVSDTHLGRQDSGSAEKQWRQAVQEISETKAAFVLHLGDVVDGGREPQYPIYAAIRKTLKPPIYEVPGNHDPDELFKKYIRTPIDTAFDHSGVRFLLFGNAHTDSHMGFITPEQIRWLDERCRDAAEKSLKIVAVCHVPVHANTHPDRGWFVKPTDGQTPFYELLDRHKDRFLACFHGHFHNGIRGWRDRNQIVEVLCPSVCYNQSRGLAEQIKQGKTSGFFVDELRPGYVLANLGKGKLTLRYKPLGTTSDGSYEADWS